MHVVIEKSTGKAVSFGDVLPSLEMCICGHTSTDDVYGHPVGVGDNKRPLGCMVSGCWHNYSTSTLGKQVQRHVEERHDHLAILWSDPDGVADKGFVSDPLPDYFEIIKIDHQPDVNEKWDEVSRSIVPRE